MGNLFQGIREFGQDNQTYSVDSSGDCTPVGVVLTGTMIGTYLVTNGVTVINTSGLITALIPSGIETTTQSLYFKNTPAQLGITIISGTTSGQLIDNQLTYNLVGTGTRAHLVNYSGQGWSVL